MMNFQKGKRWKIIEIINVLPTKWVLPCSMSSQRKLYSCVSLPTAYLHTLSSFRLFLKAEPETKVEHILFGNAVPGNKDETREETGGKGKNVQAKKVVLVSGPLVFWILSAEPSSILIKLCLRIVCLRDEKKKHLSVSWISPVCWGLLPWGSNTPRGETTWATASHALQQRRFRTRS